MFARGFATRNSLRAFLLAGAIILSGVSQLKADSINMSFNNVSPGTGVNYSNDNGANWTGTSAGQFNWTRNSGVTYLGNPNVTTFCIELSQFTGSNINYTVYTNLAGLPLPGGGMGATAATLLQVLADGYNNGNGTFNVTMGFTVTVDMIQAAVWNITRYGVDSSLDTASGLFRVTNGNATWESNVNAILTWVAGAGLAGYNASTADWFAVGLTNGGNQDQIDFVNRETYGSIPPVPAPAGVVLAGMAFACVGGYNFLRRRKAIAAV